MMSNPRLLVVFTIMLWAFLGLTLKLIASSKTFTIMTIALLASTIVNFIYYRKTSKGDPFSLNPGFVLYSLCGYFLYWVFFLLSVEFYDEVVSPPIILNYTWPFFTGLFTIKIHKRQKADWIFYLSLFSGFLGIVVLASEGSFESLNFSYSIIGLICGALTGLSYGLFSSFASTLEQPVDRARFLLVGTSLSTVLLGIVSFYKYGSSMFDLSTLDWIIALANGLLLDSMGYIFWIRAQAIAARDKMDITKIVNLANYLPIFSLALIAVFFVNERTIMSKPYFIVAFVLILLSTLIPHFIKRKIQHIDTKQAM